jgi:hypothetical protein
MAAHRTESRIALTAAPHPETNSSEHGDVLASLGLSGCIRLPLRIDPEPAARELAALPADAWEHYERHAVLHRDVRSIYVRGHSRGPVVRHSDDLPILATLPALRDLVHGAVPGFPRRALVARLRPGGYIHRHRDGYWFGDSLRLSVCISAEPEVHTFSAGRWYTFRPGEVWVLDNVREHAILHEGCRPRDQLLIDMVPDAALLACVRSGAVELGVRDESASRRLARRSALRRLQVNANFQLSRFTRRLGGPAA